MSAQGISSSLRRPGHQDSKNDRHEEERRHICNQVAAFSRIIEGLNSHDRAVNHARPHGKPDDALVRVGISGCDKQKYAQCRIHSDDHQQIVRMSVAPSPARGPHNAQCIYAEYERQTDDDQGDTEKKQAICIRHIGTLPIQVRIKSGCQKPPRKTLPEA
jgi:hypothetical protein